MAEVRDPLTGAVNVVSDGPTQQLQRQVAAISKRMAIMEKLVWALLGRLPAEDFEAVQAAVNQQV